MRACSSCHRISRSFHSSKSKMCWGFAISVPIKRRTHTARAARAPQPPKPHAPCSETHPTSLNQPGAYITAPRGPTQCSSSWQMHLHRGVRTTAQATALEHAHGSMQAVDKSPRAHRSCAHRLCSKECHRAQVAAKGDCRAALHAALRV